MINEQRLLEWIAGQAKEADTAININIENRASRYFILRRLEKAVQSGSLSSPPPVVEGGLLMEIVRAMEAKLIKTESFGEAFKNGVRNMADLIELELENIEVHGNTRTASAPVVDKPKIIAELRRLKRLMFDSGLPLSGTAMVTFGTLADRVEAGEFDAGATAKQADGGGA